MSDQQSSLPPAPCTHRWRVAPPIGDCCVGTCCLCGAQRSFTNERRPFGQSGRAHKPTARIAVPTVTPGIAALCARVGAAEAVIEASLVQP